jgi:hypothetical protein
VDKRGSSSRSWLRRRRGLRVALAALAQPCLLVGLPATDNEIAHYINRSSCAWADGLLKRRRSVL